MIIVLKAHSSAKQVRMVEKAVRELGYMPHTIHGEVRNVVAAVGDETSHKSLEVLENLDCVERVIPIQKRYKLVSREAQPETTHIRVGRVTIGNGSFHVIAGPCSVESMEQMLSIAKAAKAAGATLLRGGIFKPRTSPYDFQGLGAEGLSILRAVKKAVGLPIVSEITRQTDLEILIDVVDVLQIGARNAMNYSLLEAVAKSGKPVLLKRGLASTIEEWLLAAEYIAKNGNPNIILCERGIRTYEQATRNTLDISAVAVAKLECSLPVIVDPSHAAGRRDLIPALSKAAIAAGADGLMIEVHQHPEDALSDSAQQLTPHSFAQLMKSLAPFIKAAGMKVGKAGK